MNNDGGESAWRVGLLGDGRGSRFLLERFANGGPFRVVAVSESLLTEEEAARFAVRRERSAHQMARRSDLDLLWVTNAIDSELEQALCAGFQQGQHAVWQRSGTLSIASFDRIAAESERCGRLFLIHRPNHPDSDFLRALQFARACQDDPFRVAKLTAWTYSLPPAQSRRQANRNQRDAFPCPDTPCSDTSTPANIFNLMSDRLHQLLSLIPDQPVEVTADADSQHSSTEVGYSLLLRIRFKGGCRGEIDLRLNSPTIFQSGWLLAATRNGFHNGRHFTLTSDGELFDAEWDLPVTAAPPDPFDSLASQLRAGQAESGHIRLERSILAILSGAQRSIATGHSVSL